jgi:chromosome segregation ATPase
MKNETNTRNRRTPEQIVADLEAEIQAAKVRAAKAQAVEAPEAAPIRAELDQLRKDIRDAKRGLGQGPQSFDARRAKHVAWIEKINQEQEQAEAVLELSETKKQDLENQLAEIVSAMVSNA